MSYFQFQTTPHLISGLGSVQELKTILNQSQYQKIMLITDQGMIDHQLHVAIIDAIKSQNKNYIIFSKVQADPSDRLILEATEQAKQEKVNVIIGFGGGSSMDVAKLVALLAHPMQTQSLEKMYGVDQARGPKLPLILIPTTAGTGSEVTPIAIVTTGETTKSGIVSKALYPDYAILDATFTLNLPAQITAATGIDAMVHAIEAFTSKIQKNPYTDMLAKQALHLLNQNLTKVLKNGHDLEARQNMLHGSMLAGQAFANAPVGAVHALAYPLGGRFHIAHGHSNALVLIEVMKFNAPFAEPLYAELMQWLEPKSKGSNAALCDLFIDHMQNHLDQSGLSLRLQALNIPKESINQLAQDAMQQTRLLKNNPRELDYEDAVHIYEAIYA